MEQIPFYDIAIVGAGPAGCAAALQLRDSGLKVLMLEKSVFPRDKICGDAIPGRALKVLDKLNPKYLEEFRAMDRKVFIKRSEFHILEKEPVELQWVQEAYACSRKTFDYELFKLVQKYAGIEVIQNQKITKVEEEADGILLHGGNKAKFKAKVVIGCDGAQSVTSRYLTQRKVNHRHHCGAVRAYYKGVEGMEPNTTECYVLEKYMPGYFWIFPVDGGLVNAGFGMRSDFIADKKFNLRKAFFDFIEAYPLLREKMKNAELVGKLDGFSLPMGSQWVKMSGERFFLAGDAASLIDPVSGDGIGNAMFSGETAARHARKAIQEQDYSGKQGEAYEAELYGAIGKELHRKGIMQQLGSNNAWMLKYAVFMVQNRWIKRLMHKML